VYVAVTSVDPLRVYTYDNLLMRHCTGNYSNDLANSPRESYVVAEDYSPPWAIPSLRPYYTLGMSTANVLRAYLADRGAFLTSPALLLQQNCATVKSGLHHRRSHLPGWILPVQERGDFVVVFFLSFLLFSFLC
jgi:hypothetical protein